MSVLELAERLDTPGLSKGLCNAVADILVNIATQLRKTECIDIAISPPASISSSKGSLYTQFISEMTPAARRVLPGKAQKARLLTLASLWTRYKALGTLDDILSAATSDLESLIQKESVPIYTIDVVV